MIFSRAIPAFLIAASGLLLALTATSSGQVESNVDAIAPARQPMALGAASNFSQGWNEQVFAAALDLAPDRLRDGMNWAAVERVPGQYRFDLQRTRLPARLQQSGGQMVLTVSGGNPLYDNGDTPHTPAVRAALGRFVAAVVERYPAITAVEVGNEFNSADFVTGPVRQGGLRERAGHHLGLLRAVAGGVRRVRPEVKILGGATHSIPAGYLWSVLDGAEPGLIDGLVIHPYSTPIDQLAAQIGVLRRHPAARNLPIHVTEFASRSETLAPDEMLRAFATMSSLGFAAMDWYPLNERGDATVPLLRRDGSVTSAGEAFRLIRAELGGKVSRDISPDPFTFVHAFGSDRMVLWGEPRPVMLGSSGIEALDARGHRLDPAGLALSPERALILKSDQPIRLGVDVLLGCSTLIADSFWQFAYPAGGSAAPAGSFATSLRLGGNETMLETLPGQQRGGVPWVPYLGRPDHRMIWLTAERIALGTVGRPRGREVVIVQRWVPPASGNLRVEASLATSGRSGERVEIEIRQGRRVLFARGAASELQFTGTIEPIPAAPLEILVAGNGASAASAEYRWRVHDTDRCMGAESLPPVTTTD